MREFMQLVCNETGKVTKEIEVTGKSAGMRKKQSMKLLDRYGKDLYSTTIIERK